MNKKIVVHFGAGALGRGLVVPLLYQSGYEIVLVDTNEELNKTLNETRSYIVDISDQVPKNRDREIKIVEAISPNENGKLSNYLREASIVTTSVRRENLIHVAKTLVNTWGLTDDEYRIVICCENIEKVGGFFKGLLKSVATTSEQKKRIDKVLVPDTIVDRICAVSWPKSTLVTSEIFHECSVDSKVVENTGIELIPSVRNIEADFSRKRFLLNTYADSISFIALNEGKTYLYEAAESYEINEIVSPYMNLLQKMLQLEYGCDKEELNQWRTKYQERLSNREIPRHLDSVARNLWLKLTIEERFVWPLAKLLDHNVDISEGIAFLSKLIHIGIQLDSVKLNNYQVKVKLKELWCANSNGETIYKQVLKFL